MKQNEYYINPNGFADPNDKFVCYSHRTKKVTVHCADGSTHPSAHTYDTIKQIMAKGDYWKKVDYQTAYRLLKPLDQTEILHYYVPTTKSPHNAVELISCNKITKKSTVYYKDGRVQEMNNYARCGKLRLVTKQEALSIIGKKVSKAAWTDIKFDNPLKHEDEVKEDDVVYYGPKPFKFDLWPITAYIEHNKTKNTVAIVDKTGKAMNHAEMSWLDPSKIDGLAKDWKTITKEEALARVKTPPPIKEKTEDEKEYERIYSKDAERYVNLYYISAKEPWATTAYLVCHLHSQNVFAVKYDGSVEWFKGLYGRTCSDETEAGNWKEVSKEEAFARVRTKRD